MATKYTKKQSNAKVNFDFSSFGGGKKPSKRNQKKAVKTVKNIGFKGILLALLFLLIGVGVGFGGFFIITKNDCFEINGQDYIEWVPNVAYVDEGCKIISFGKDVSKDVVIETNLLSAEDGSFYAIENGEYYIKYTSKDIKYGTLFDVKKFRIIHISDKNEEGSISDEG